MKGLEMRPALHIAELQSVEVAEPTERAPDSVARLAQAAAVWCETSIAKATKTYD